MQDLLESLDERTTVVTVNRRLARALRGAHDRVQLARGVEVWPTPDIVPYDAWLRRLMTYDIDHLVLLPPDPPEAVWVKTHPELFRLVAAGYQGRAHAYRFDRGQAARAMELSRRAAR